MIISRVIIDECGFDNVASTRLGLAQLAPDNDIVSTRTLLSTMVGRGIPS